MPQNISMVSIFFICISVIMFCLKTYPNFRNPMLLPLNFSIKETHEVKNYEDVWNGAIEDHKHEFEHQRALQHQRSIFDIPANESDSWGATTSPTAAYFFPPPENASDAEWPKVLYYTKTGSNEHEAFFYVECVCNVWFIMEIVVRLICAPSRTAFYRSPLNLIDIIATSSFVCDTALFHVFNFQGVETVGDVLEFFSIIRIMRLFKLTKHSAGALTELPHCFILLHLMYTYSYLFLFSQHMQFGF